LADLDGTVGLAAHGDSIFSVLSWIFDFAVDLWPETGISSIRYLDQVLLDIFKYRGSLETPSDTVSFVCLPRGQMSTENTVTTSPPSSIADFDAPLNATCYSPYTLKQNEHELDTTKLQIGQTMKITPISNAPSVTVAVVADEENVIATKNNFDTASRVDDDASLHSSSSSSRWTKCLIAGAIALVAVVAVSVALPLINTREAEDAALQITFGMNQSSNNETRFYKSITSNGRHGICSIDEQGSSITYTPNEGFFGIDTCTYTVIVCTDTDLCDSTEETITVVVEDPDAPVTSPDAMVLVGRGVTDSTTSTARLMSSTITSTSSTTPAQTTTSAPDEEGGASSAATTTSVPTTAI